MKKFVNNMMVLCANFVFFVAISTSYFKCRTLFYQPEIPEAVLKMRKG